MYPANSKLKLHASGEVGRGAGESFVCQFDLNILKDNSGLQAAGRPHFLKVGREKFKDWKNVTLISPDWENQNYWIYKLSLLKHLLICSQKHLSYNLSFYILLKILGPSRQKASAMAASNLPATGMFACQGRAWD